MHQSVVKDKDPPFPLPELKALDKGVVKANIQFQELQRAVRGLTQVIKRFQSGEDCKPTHEIEEPSFLAKAVADIRQSFRALGLRADELSYEDKVQLNDIAWRIREKLSPVLVKLEKSMKSLRSKGSIDEETERQTVIFCGRISVTQTASAVVHQVLMTQISPESPGRTSRELISELAFKEPEELCLSDAENLYKAAKENISLPEEARQICILLGNALENEEFLLTLCQDLDFRSSEFAVPNAWRAGLEEIAEEVYKTTLSELSLANKKVFQTCDMDRDEIEDWDDAKMEWGIEGTVQTLLDELECGDDHKGVADVLIDAFQGISIFAFRGDSAERAVGRFYAHQIYEQKKASTPGKNLPALSSSGRNP